MSDALRGEIAALKLELVEQRKFEPVESMIRGIDAALSAKIEALQNQLGQKLSNADGRGELAEFKATLQTITQRIARLDLAATGSDQAVFRDAMGSKTAAGELGGQRAGQPLDNPTTMAVESPRNPGEQSISRDAKKEQLKQLQQRMSAEIERVRAKLKERSGRWKVRRGVAAP